MKLITLISLLFVASSWACTPAGNTNASTINPNDEPANKMAAPAPVQELELLVKSSELRVDDEQVWFEPDSAVQRATYVQYVFDKAEFEKIVGTTKPDSDVALIIQITKTEEKTHTPTDPNSPSPDGGFGITIHHAKILRLK